MTIILAVKDWVLGVLKTEDIVRVSFIVKFFFCRVCISKHSQLSLFEKCSHGYLFYRIGIPSHVFDFSLLHFPSLSSIAPARFSLWKGETKRWTGTMKYSFNFIKRMAFSKEFESHQNSQWICAESIEHEKDFCSSKQFWIVICIEIKVALISMTLLQIEVLKY